MSDPTLFVRDYNIRPRQYQTPCFSCEITISGPNNVIPYIFVREYNIRPHQICQTPHFSFENTISGPDNVRPHAFRASLQYQAPTMSDPTLFVRDYNIRPRQCQTPRFSCETTISGPDNVRPHAFRARLQYHAPTMSDLTLVFKIELITRWVKELIRIICYILFSLFLKFSTLLSFVVWIKYIESHSHISCLFYLVGLQYVLVKVWNLNDLVSNLFSFVSPSKMSAKWFCHYTSCMKWI